MTAVVTCTAGLGLAASAYATSASTGDTPPASGGAPPPGGQAGAMVRSDRTAYAKALASTDWVRTPAGLVHKDCVHRVPNDTTVDRDGAVLPSGERQTFPACAHPRLVNPAGDAKSRATAVTQDFPTDGWLVSTWWDSPTWVRRMTADYTVPAAPASNGAVDFFFSSLEPAAQNEIVQPVLTYGANNDGNGNPIGGNNWYINSWYVPPTGSAVIGPTVQVSPGDTIRGLMDGTNCSNTGTNCTWIVSSVSARTGQESRINVQSPPAYPTVQGGVFEAYGATSCAMFPADRHITFSNIRVYGPTLNALTPSYHTYNPNPECGMSASYSSTSTDIRWNG